MLQIDKKWVRALGAFGLAAIVGLVAGCGGGGGSSGSGGSGGTSSTGGSGSSTTSSGGNTNTVSSTTGGATGRSLVASGTVSSITGPLAANQVEVDVATGVAGAANIPTVTVTVCVHGTGTCATIPNVQLDTGSFGLRLTKDAVDNVNNTFLAALPVQTLIGGQAVAECMGFADGNSWGSVRVADVKIGSETATSMPIQILGDVAQSQAGGSNNACAFGTLHDTSTGSTGIAANGILGIGTAKYDCGDGCQNKTANNIYYGCTNIGGTLTGCTDSAVPNLQQVANPVQSFTSGDTSGVVLNMPPVGSTGAVSAKGILTFGVGTLPGGVQKFTTDHFGDVQSATLDGSTYLDTTPTQRAAFFDTGSNGLFLPGTHSGLLLCTGGSGFYCPTSAVALQPSVTGFNGTTATLPISIENAFDLFNGGGFAFSNLGGQSGLLAVDFGMPFFYGKTVYITYDTASTGSLGVAAPPASVAF